MASICDPDLLCPFWGGFEGTAQNVGFALQNNTKLAQNFGFSLGASGNSGSHVNEELTREEVGKSNEKSSLLGEEHGC